MPRRDSRHVFALTRHKECVDILVYVHDPRAGMIAEILAAQGRSAACYKQYF